MEQVVDAETNEPIKEFRVVPGIRSTIDHMNWARRENFMASAWVSPRGAVEEDVHLPVDLRMLKLDGPGPADAARAGPIMDLRDRRSGPARRARLRIGRRGFNDRPRPTRRASRRGR